MKSVLPCAIYTRKSSEEGLEQDFNSLDAQREACEAFIQSQKAQGWRVFDAAYDDGGFSGGNTERPALKRLLADIVARRIRIVVVYKVDRLTRSLADFAKLVELFDTHDVSFVSVTQQFNTTSSMGRLTLNVLLSFAQFEREVTGERIRDKIAASKRKGMWMGGLPPVGYVASERTLQIDEPQAERIRAIYRLYLELNCVRQLQCELDRRGWVTPTRHSKRRGAAGGRAFSRGHLYRILTNPVYIGKIAHKDAVFDGQHPAILDEVLWQTVQERLTAHRQGHRVRANAAEPSLLTGLLFDGEGHRLTPTHAQKGARRYRYYVGQPLHVQGREEVRDGLRWPAREVEAAVIDALGVFLRDEARLLGLMGEVEASEVREGLRRAASLAERLCVGSSSDRIDVLQKLVERITIHPTQVDLSMRVAALGLSGDSIGDDERTTMITVPVALQRCGMAVRLIVHGPGARTREPDANLIALLAKAQDWFARLTSGRCDSLQAIAREEGRPASSYISDVVSLAFLDPGIVNSILRGEQPPALNATRLIRCLPLPLAWGEQRARLGFAD